MANDLAEELGGNIPLSEMIQTLRTELAVAISTGRDEWLRFDVEEVDLELQVKVARGVQGSGRVSFWVVGVEGGANKGDESVHTFRLKLKPRNSGKQGPVSVSDTERELPG